MTARRRSRPASAYTGSAGIPALSHDSIVAPDIAALRAKVEIVAGPAYGRDEAAAEILLRDGTPRRAHVRHARGSTARPMTDAELDAKCLGQACAVLSDPDAEALLGRLRAIAAGSDVAAVIGNLAASRRHRRKLARRRTAATNA